MKTWILAASLLWAGSASAQPQAAAPETYEQARAEAKAKYEAKDLPGALEAMQRALKLASAPGEKSAALLRIGQAHKDLKQAEDARSAWAQVLELPGAPAREVLGAHLAIGGSWLEEQQNARARAAFEAVLAMPGGDDRLRAVAQVNIGSSYYNEKDFERARPALAIVADNPEAEPFLRRMAQRNIGESHFKERNFPSARLAWQRLLAMPGVTPSIAGGIEALILDTYRQEKDQAGLDKIGQEFYAAHSSQLRALTRDSKWAPAREEAAAMVLLLPQAEAANQVLALGLVKLSGEFYLNENLFAQARAEFQKVLASTPAADATPAQIQAMRTTQQVAQQRIGLAYVGERRFSLARAQFEKVLALPYLDASLKAATEKELAKLAGAP